MTTMLYRDSLSRIYGAPGSGKSFLAMDMALSLAAGRFWCGRRLDPATVIYVMAEGQAVNADRVEAWMSQHDVTLDQLNGRFFAVPDAVSLTEYGVKPLAKWVTGNRPALVILDTKNAMMFGDENSASDFAAMRRALDVLRKAASCCVLLVDHTGYEGNRARGSSAGTAAMDTEIRVTKDDDERPALVTAEVTRDKAAESGSMWAWRLVPEHPAAVLMPTEVPEAVDHSPVSEWIRSTTPEQVPLFIRERKDGPGKIYLADLARMMMFETAIERDPSRLGMTLAKAQQVLPQHERTGVRRAWSTLKDRGYLECTLTDPSELQNDQGPHVWSGPSELLEDRLEINNEDH